MLLSDNIAILFRIKGTRKTYLSENDGIIHSVGVGRIIWSCIKPLLTFSLIVRAISQWTI